MEGGGRGVVGEVIIVQALTPIWDNLAGIFQLQNSLRCWVKAFVLIA